tara:strand:+ start:697 stop:1914 length:1218 start_codon:yes stop_codon:yes gene_type:complete
MALFDTALRNAKPGLKPYKLYDEKGLFLIVTPAGGKWWRYRYKFNGKEKELSFGTYPDVGLQKARDKRDAARKLLADGVDPSEHRKAQKASRLSKSANSFEVVAREWFAAHEPNWGKSHSSKIIRRLEKEIFPWLGNRPIHEITAPELLTSIRRIQNRGVLETAHRTLANCGQIFRYAIATGRTERDTAADLRGSLPPVKEKHHASITDPKAIGGLLRAIKGFSGSYITMYALQLAPMVFVRPGELRRAEWLEIDLDKAEWRIPAEKMKMDTLHIVPLSIQAISILREIQPLTGSGKYVFSSLRTHSRPMSENTVNAALRRLGYSKDEMTGHGFRSMASTLLHEQGWPHEAIERQLAHSERNKVVAAYNYAEHLPERRKMMQHWSDYLEGLEKGADVVPLFRKTT